MALLALALLPFAACSSNESPSETNPGPDAGVGEDSGIGIGDVDPARGVESVETSLVRTPAKAGEPLRVDCKLLDADGERIETDESVDFELVLSPEDSFEKNDSGEWIPVRSGRGRVACAARAFNVVDETPETFQIEPGSPHTVRTALGKNRVTAGTGVEASCSVFDEFGNAVEDADPSVDVDAMGAGISVDGTTVTIEKADTYRVTCTLDGVQNEFGASLEVNPAVPASFSMAALPQKQVYGLGEVVRFSTAVTDEFGNEVRRAEVGFDLRPAATPFGNARWEFNKEGTFEVTGTVQGDTKDDAELSETATIVVNGDGPDIQCQNPADGTMVDRTTSGTITFDGSVSDTHDVSSVTVGGDSVNVGSNGAFSTEINVRYGMNFLDIEATDQFGAENSKTCAFLVSNHWQNPSNFFTDAVGLDLEQSALDDGSRSGSGLDSIADAFYEILNSSELLVRVDGALRSNNPLVKDKCFANDPLFGFCLVRGDVLYIRDPEGTGSPGSGLSTGTNTISLDWTQKGMSVSTTLANNSSDDVRIRLKFDTGSCGTFRGWLEIADVTASLESNINLKNGNLEASLVNNSTSVSSGTVSTNFGGVCGNLAGLLEGILQNTYQNTVEGILKDQLESLVPTLLDNLVSSLDVSTLADRFSIPSFDGQGAVDVDFNVRFTELKTNTSRALIGLGTKFSPKSTSVSLPSKGVPHPTGDVLHEPNVPNNDVGASMYIGVVNHILHALWRGGIFEGKLGSPLFGSSAPQGTKAELSLNLPPVAKLESPNQVDVMMGSVTLTLTYPGLFDKPIVFEIGLVAETGVQLKQGDTLQFQNIKITEFFFTPRNISLDSRSRSIIESFIRDLFQKVIDRSLNQGLPGIPIPSFTVSSTLANFGLSQGAELGIKNPTLDAVTNHFTLKGDFGKK